MDLTSSCEKAIELPSVEVADEETKEVSTSEHFFEPKSFPTTPLTSVDDELDEENRGLKLKSSS